MIEDKQEVESPYREYANNLYFDPSAWDLTVTFGQLGIRLPGQEKPGIDWHTSVTLPWTQAKMLAYYVFVNVLLHEQDQGPIVVPDNLIPNEPKLTNSESSDEVRLVQEKLKSIHEELFKLLGK